MEVGLGGNPQDGVEEHIQDTTVRYDQVLPWRTVEQALDSFPGPQVQLPLALTGLANRLVGMDELWLG